MYLNVTREGEDGAKPISMKATSNCNRNLNKNSLGAKVRQLLVPATLMKQSGFK